MTAGETAPQQQPPSKGGVMEGKMGKQTHTPHWYEVGPELLAALQECVTLLGGIPAAKNNQRVADAIHNARAAIAKATQQPA